MSEKIDNSHLLEKQTIDDNNNFNYNIIVKDKLHEYINIHYKDNLRFLTILNEIIFYGGFGYYYYFGPIQDSNKTFLIVKYILLIFVLRYLFNYITSYTVDKDNTKSSSRELYFQINSKIAIFSILVLFLTYNTHNITTLLMILAYALISSAAQYGYTVDNLLTVLIIYSIFHSKIIN